MEGCRRGIYKKEGYLSQTPNLYNLKSNTMKNTMQMYERYVLKHNNRA